MTVAELCDKLKSMPSDAIVLIQAENSDDPYYIASGHVLSVYLSEDIVYITDEIPE